MSNVSLVVFMISLFGVISCTPEKDYLVDVDYNKVPYLIQDNHYLSTFSRALQLTGVDRQLEAAGPYTTLVPSDAGLLLDGIGPDQVQTLSPAYLGKLVNHHLLDGWYELNKLPFLFNQEITSRAGLPIYVSRWVKGQDTVLTINGIIAQPRLAVASNGLVMILDRMISPNVYDNVMDCIRDEERLTLFAHALTRTGLDELLRRMPSCTVFAPSNAAMAAFGFPTLQSIQQADVAELAALIRYHIQEDRRFIHDFALVIQADEVGAFPLDYVNKASNQVETMTSFAANRGRLKLRMLDGNAVTFTYTTGKLYIGAAQEDRYRFTLTDVTGQEAAVSIVQNDYVARNGFIHQINNVLKHTR